MKRSYFERYRRGEHESVWRELVAMGEQIRHSSVHEDALEVARETMRRVLANAKMLASRLKDEGYEFGWPHEILIPPPDSTAAMLAQIEREAGALPLSLRALYEVVGSVNLVGTHVELCPEVGEIYSDPLQTTPIDYAIYQLEEWKEERATIEGDDAEPFEVSVSADDYHKADVSGGAPYSIQINKPSMDRQLMYERHELLLVEYLRLSFAWGGFPGFDRVGAHPPMAIIEKLRCGLLEI